MKLSFTYKQTQPLMLMFLVAFSLRLLASFLLQSWISPNTFEYGAIAQNVLAGKGYSLPFIEPGIEIKDPFFFLDASIISHFSDSISLVFQKPLFLAVDFSVFHFCFNLFMYLQYSLPSIWLSNRNVSRLYNRHLSPLYLDTY